MAPFTFGRPMKSKLEPVLLPASLLLFLLPLAACAPPVGDPARAAEVTRWEERSSRVTIHRDEWGVPHIFGPTDADVVFGLMFAQAEDDFPRIEENLLNSQGRWAEAVGEEALWRDLRMRLFIDPEEMRTLYAESPDELRALLDGWADGLNFYLHTHPEVRPRVLHRFEPWMALTFSEGSIGGDIERVSLTELQAFYENPLPRVGGGAIEEEARYVAGLLVPDPLEEPRGSNGIAIAPQNTRAGNALLLINPHTSFYFRQEAHLVSEEGLNAYGALTWGQFFVYQGFNAQAGWMHTSSSADNIDEFLETVYPSGSEWVYRVGEEDRPFVRREVQIRVRSESGELEERVFPVYRTHRGPVVRAVGDRWVSVALMENPRDALLQSFSRMKAANLSEFLQGMRGHTNSSNNTLFADSEGNIAYLHANFVPVRDPRFDYSRPVDGSDPAVDWQGIHSIEASPNSINPSTGFAFCTNNWPYSASGSASPDPAAFPAYMDRGRENPRGVHALRLLEGRGDYTLEGLMAAAYSRDLPAFDEWIPSLASAWRSLSDADSLRIRTEESIRTLEGWDRRWGEDSEATTLAVFWATELLARTQERARESGLDPLDFARTQTSMQERVEALELAQAQLVRDFGSAQIPWGEVNRFQRLSGDIRLAYDDNAPSLPVGFPSARWGSLASFGATPREGTRRWYGSSGNSFVAVVEFGERLRAYAITAGGLSNDPASPHFLDQAERYSKGDLRPVHFHRDEVLAAAVRSYRPGEP